MKRIYYSRSSKLANIYPIFFGITLGHATRRLAAWQLEKGASLLSLEQLMGSLSIGSTFATQLALDGFNYLGLFLVLTWTLAPLAGQASLRLLAIDQAQIRSTVNITYQGSLGQDDGDNTGGPPGPDTGNSRIYALYDASLFAPTSVKTSPLDIWGNVKIPDISEGSCGINDVNGTAIPGCQRAYTSLLGVPIASVPNVGNTTFTIETSSYSVGCHNVSQSAEVENYGIIDSNDTTFMRGQLENYWGPVSLSDNPDLYPFSLATNYLLSDNFTALNDLGISQDFLVDGDTYPAGQTTLLLQSRDLPTSVYASLYAPAYTRVYCTLSTSYIQSDVSCTAGDCAVNAARPSLLQQFPLNVTQLMFLDTFFQFSQSLIEESLHISNYSSSDIIFSLSSPTQMYLENPFFSHDFYYTTYGYANLSNVTEAEFSIRLEQILNTYWQAGSQIFTSFDSLADPDSPFYNPFGMNFTLGTNVIWQKHYRCQLSWLIVYFIATVVMLTAAVTSLWLSWLVQGPEVLGYCSSLVKDSRYINVPNRSTMRGAERAKKLGRLKLRLADVAGDQDVGHIAIVDAGAVDDDKIMPLSKGRKYD